MTVIIHCDDSIASPKNLERKNEMLTQKSMKSILRELSVDRPVFHSEDDFKFALAWRIKETCKNAKIRLEYPVRDVKKKPNLEMRGDKYIDLLVSFGETEFPIELKYKTMESSFQVGGEFFELKEHGAQNENRYRFWRDIWRIENFKFSKGFVIFLTNNQTYLHGDGDNCLDKAFRIHEKRTTKNGSSLKWGSNCKTGSKPQFVSPIKLMGDYSLHWEEYSNVPDAPKGKFDYLLVEVKK